MIGARHLSKLYGAAAALKDVSFSVSQGETVGFLGPNGAGKSTVMNIISGYLEPSLGEVEIAGIPMAEEPLEARKHIGYLPEIAPLYMDMTVSEQLEYAAMLRGLPYRGAALRDYISGLCSRTDILASRTRLIRNLSKGYRQRVAVTQLLVGEPEILILDEPTVGLDPRQTREFRDLLLELKGDRTIIISSHILSEIRSVCGRVLIFNRGELIADGVPEKLEEEYSGKKVLLARIKGELTTVKGALESIGGVMEVEICPAPEEDAETYRIFYDRDTDIREAVYEALKPLPAALLGLGPEEVSLENLYLRITERAGEP